jgi:hypothetical protein
MDDQWTRRIADRLNWDRLVTAQVTDPPPPPSTDPRAAVSAVLLAPTPDEFVRRAYRLALGRDPSPAELAQRVRRLKLPFFTRGWLLRRLLGSAEGQLVRRAEQVQAAEAARRTADYLEAVVPQLLAADEQAAAAVARLREAVERAAGGPPGGTACGS